MGEAIRGFIVSSVLLAFGLAVGMAGSIEFGDRLGLREQKEGIPAVDSTVSVITVLFCSLVSVTIPITLKLEDPHRGLMRINTGNKILVELSEGLDP